MKNRKVVAVGGKRKHGAVARAAVRVGGAIQSSAHESQTRCWLGPIVTAERTQGFEVRAVGVHRKDGALLGKAPDAGCSIEPAAGQKQCGGGLRSVVVGVHRIAR